jgi:hypothetical protein
MRTALFLSLAALVCAAAQAEPAKTTIPADAVTRAIALRDALTAGPDDPGALDDDELRTVAADVRDLVRQYV